MTPIPVACSDIVEIVQILLGRRDVLAAATLSLIGVGIPLWLAGAAGAVGLPTIDDWVYIRGAENLFRSGSLDMPGHTAAAIGQLVLVQPLLWLSGGATWAFTTFGLIMTLVGIIATYFLARRFVGTGSAVMVVLLVLAVPGVARLSASFMTDIPAYALGMLCLLLGTRWLQGEGGRRTLLAALGFGILAVSIREFAIAAPIAVLAAGWARSRPDDRVWLAGASTAFVAGAGGVLALAVLAPGRGSVAASDLLAPLIFLPAALVSLAAILLPVLVLAIGWRMSTLSPPQIVLAAGLVLFLFVPPLGDRPGGGGNLWTPVGVLGDGLLFGTRPAVLDDPVWVLSKQLAAFATMLTLILAIRWGRRRFALATAGSSAAALAIDAARSPHGLLALFLFAYAAELIVFSQVWLYDRFLYPLVPIAAILLLRRPAGVAQGSRSLAFSHAAMAWLAVTAFVIAANSFAYDAARWREGETAVAMGFDARTVDAGYEWVGYHSSAGVQPGSGTYDLSWYDDALLLAPPCAVLSSSRLAGGALRLIRVTLAAYRQFLFFGPEQPLYLYGATSAACSTPP
ncbi:MAG: glycosyltransferase family 39 protein [Chloroflexi bacterium]|nr:glycosyltransferase family 39 protein [Chloroflexota bacterium]